ncbi:MAG: immune inhibitor A [Anaerolineae bacterium]|nr:immune inhibitor A [Anaerolineae bacterium]
MSETRVVLRMGRTWVMCLVVIGVAVCLAMPPVAAQDGKRADSPSWDDAPNVPRHRSQADWLLDVGQATYEQVYGPFFSQTYAVGDAESFIPLGSNSGMPQMFVLRARTEHAYFWFERSMLVDAAELEWATRFFEERIWPLNNTIYGDEWNPGIDGDPRIHIVNQSGVDADSSIMGAFDPRDQCPAMLCPQSNQREIIYINLIKAPLSSQEYLATLAHEHQHLIQHHMDGNEDRWLNEGLSQLAEHFNGFHPQYIAGPSMRDLLRDPDHHLNGWTTDRGQQSRYYGASYLFMLYLYERFGLDFIRTLASDSYDGLAAVQNALTITGQGLTVDEVFADWIVANLLDDPYVGGGRYFYQTLDLPQRIQPVALDGLQADFEYTDSINQYGADYLSLSTPGTYDIQFDGSEQVPVVNISPYSGDWMWWSYNTNSGAARLNGAFDLTGQNTATLVFRAWWDIQADYDWFHVLVSPDGGQSWQIVGGEHAVSGDPYTGGPYYDGRSGGWVEERINLTPYAGGPLLVRFEYLTNGSRSLSGVVLDDVGIAELGYVDDVESALSLWAPDGFMRIPHVVLQNWRVTLAINAPGWPADVRQLDLDNANNGRAAVTVPEDGSVTIVIGAMAPFTSAQADYKLVIREHTS